MPIERFSNPADLPPRLRGGVIAIGNFDGVHRGHQAVLGRALDMARADGCPALALTFEPHPRSVFNPDKPVFRLTPAPLRARILGALGFDAVVEQPFTREFASLEPDVFIDDILHDALGIAHAVTGYDFHFGHKRRGNPEYLAARGERDGFDVTLVEAFRDEGDGVISSSRIRALLETGDVAEAAGLLGYRYTVQSPVTNGKKLGRTLGFPTANMVLAPEATLKHGIYAVRLRRADGSLHDGVASFGRRPTVDEAGAPLLETFVFDFDDGLYGEICAVSFFGFLRGEEKFDGLEGMVAQMKRDQEEARALLSGVRPQSALDADISF